MLPHRPGMRRRRGALRFALVVVLLVTAVSSSTQPASAAGAVTRPVFAFYYLWWSRSHWTQMLGPNYPMTTPLTLPAKLDATGCNPVSLYPGNQLTDVPTTLWGQDDPGLIESDVRRAAAAGLTGFIVNWNGTGDAAQTPSSTPYNRRLQAMVAAVHKVNAEGIPFKLWLSYKASAVVLPVSHILNDLQYFYATYGHDNAFARLSNGKETVIYQGSWKYSEQDLQAVSVAWGAKFRILGDEKLSTWGVGNRKRWLAGDAYYWSSQNPWTNPASFGQLQQLASMVRGSGLNPDGTKKVWIAPVNPGYDKQLLSGSNCVPRDNGNTLKALFSGNAASNPDAWGLISWNEITEGTYVVPLTRYGTQYLDLLHSLIEG